MDRTTLLEAVRSGPVHLNMNDRTSYEIPNLEFCLATDIAAHVLIKGPDGELRAKYLALVAIDELEPA